MTNTTSVKCENGLHRFVLNVAGTHCQCGECRNPIEMRPQTANERIAHALEDIATSLRRSSGREQ